jgi:hypothetical protein
MEVPQVGNRAAEGGQAQAEGHGKDFKGRAARSRPLGRAVPWPGLLLRRTCHLHHAVLPPAWLPMHGL